MATRATTQGYKWEDKFRDSIYETFPGAFVHKMIDTHAIEGALRKIKRENPQYGNFVIPKVPADYIVVIDGQTTFVECKSTQKDGFPRSNIKDHQIEFALEIEGAGGRYMFAIRRHVPYKSKVYLVSGGELVNMFIREGKKTLSWDRFDNNPEVIEAKAIKGGLFDVKGVETCYSSRKMSLSDFT